VDPAHIREYCELDDTSKALMRSAMNQLGMSARAFHRVLKLARTIANLARSDHIQAAHLAEAIPLRSTEKTRILILAFSMTGASNVCPKMQPISRKTLNDQLNSIQIEYTRLYFCSAGRMRQT
jgi:hypothetical protein